VEVKFFNRLTLQGDLHDGAGLSDVTKPDGLETDELVKLTDFDLLTVGNHELVDPGLPNSTHMNLAKHFGDRYITSNVYVNDTTTNTTELEPIGSQSYYFKTSHGLRIMAFGVMFDMNPPARDTEIHLAKAMMEEPWFNSAIHHEDIDLFVLIGHNPVRLNETDLDNNSTLKKITDTIQERRPGIPVQVFGGHSHIRDFMVYSETSTALESGRYGDTVGWLAMTGIESSTYTGVMNPAGVPNPTRPAKKVNPQVGGALEPRVESDLRYARRYLDFNRETFQFHTGTTNDNDFDTADGLKVSSKITELRDKYKLNKYFGCAPRSYCISCKPPGDEGSIYTLVRDALEKIVVSTTRNDTSRILLSNRNGIRYDLAQGPFTRDDSFIVCPFTDGFRYVGNVTAEHASQIVANLDGCQHSQGEGVLEESHWTGSTQKVLSRRGADDVLGMVASGYTTTDDFGLDGDDTQHSPIQRHEPLPYVQGNVTIRDSAGKLPEFYDVVYIQHLEKKVLAALKCLDKGHTYQPDDYVGKAINTNSLLELYASQYWNQTAETCAVGGSL
jgi:2',3'-cyclic-nucleotide 2'-phosphodiesterase (5'-nucleotidase family)